MGSWAWKKVIPLLEKQGHSSYPVTLTGTGERVHLASESLGIETAIQDVLNVIEYNDLDRFVMVGHSFAGKVAAAAADRASGKVGTLLYVDAYRPAKARKPQGAFSDEYPVDGWKVPFPVEILAAIGKDVQGADREWLLSKATPLPVRYFREPVTLSERFDTLRKANIFCTGGGDPIDDILKGKWGEVDGPYRVIDSGHWPMITKPQELVDDMLALTR